MGRSGEKQARLGNSKCEGPEAGMCSAGLRGVMEAVADGAGRKWQMRSGGRLDWDSPLCQVGATGDSEQISDGI